MPYKDREQRLEAQRRHYRENRERYRETQRRLRAIPGYRDSEYAKRRESRPPRPLRLKVIQVNVPKKPRKVSAQPTGPRSIRSGLALDIEASVRCRAGR